MARDRAVFVRLRASVAELTGPFKDAAKAVRDVGTAAKDAESKARGSLSGMAQHIRDNKDAWNDVGGALTTYGAAVTGLSGLVLATGISYNTLRQRSVAALTTMTGSAEKANAQMDKLDDFASNSPFARDVFIRAQQQLIGFGREAEEVVPILDAIQNAVAATGGSNQDIEELVRIIAQVGAAGKITAEDLNQFGQRGVDAATLIGSQMGKTGQQIREEITSGTLDADAAIAALVTGMDERFGGAAAGVKETMDGAVDRVKAAFRDIGASFASVLVDPQGGGLLVDGLNSLADGMRAFEDLPTPIRNTAIALAMISGPAALAAGGFLLLAPRAVETWDALSKMGRVGGAAQGALRGVSKLVAPGAALLAGLTLIPAALNAIRDATSESIPGIEGVGSALLDLVDSDSVSSLDRQIADLKIQTNGLTGIAEGPITDLDGAFRRLSAPSTIQQLEALDKVASFGQLRTSKDDVLDYFASVDGYIAQLATGGDTETATRLLDEMWHAASGAGMSREDFDALFSGAREALQGVENDARLAASGADEFADAMVRIDPSVMQGKATEIRQANEDILQSFLNLGEGINDQELSLDGWIAQLEEQINAAANYADNIATIRGAGVSEAFVSALMAEGEGGAMRAQQIADRLVGGDAELVDTLNGIGREAAGEGGLMGGAQAALDGSDPLVMKAEAQAEAQQIADEKERLNSIFLRDPATVTLDADAEPAMEKGYEVLQWALEQTGIMGLDADDTDATMKIDQWNALANNTEGLPTLNADPEKAEAQLAALIHDMNVAVGVSTLDANKGPADAKTFAWERDADNTYASATLDAYNGPAFSALHAFLNAIPRSVSVGIRAVPILGALAGRMPGFDTGGYTGPGNRLDVAGLVHADEFVHKKAHVNRPGMLQFHTDLWKTDDLDGAYLRHKLRGYADGGPVGRAPAMSAASSSVTAVLDAEDRALLRAVADRPVYASVNIGPRQSAQIVNAGNHANRKYGGGRP